MTKTASRAQYACVSEPDGPPGSGLDAFDAIYQRELDYVCRNLGRLGVPVRDIPDAAHDVFVILYRKWNEIDPNRSSRAWLFGVARRVASSARRQRHVPSEIDPPSPDQGLVQRDLVWSALAELDDDRRAVVILHDLEGHTGTEIAEILEIPANTVHSRLRLAREELFVILRRLRSSP